MSNPPTQRFTGLFSFSAWHPAYRSIVTIDAFAAGRHRAQAAQRALRSLRRYVARENARLAACGVPDARLLPVPTARSIRLEPRGVP
jgi:hypothetical protein